MFIQIQFIFGLKDKYQNMSESFDVYPKHCQSQEKQEVLQNSSKEPPWRGLSWKAGEGETEGWGWNGRWVGPIANLDIGR